MNSATKLTLTTTADKGWIEFVSSISHDIFMQGYCGYWARGVMHNKKRGWLVFETGSDAEYTDEELKSVMRDWRMGRKLPKNWHRFDVDLANAAWLEGVRRFGESWYEDGDGPRYDWVLQKALFPNEKGGGVRYG